MQDEERTLADDERTLDSDEERTLEMQFSADSKSISFPTRLQPWLRLVDFAGSLILQCVQY